MEVVHLHQKNQERRIGNGNSTSPERGKAGGGGRSSTILRVPTFKKVQVVYYLSRNGHLQHPHYIEVTHLAHQPLRLKDVIDRLIVLRGKGMPSLYSWSCKRSYKNGYVWNDLAENDAIYPSEGAEYVLKGSELIDTCTEKLHHLQQSNVPPHQSGQDSRAHQKPKHLGPKRRPEPEEFVNSQYLHYDDGEKTEEDEEDEYVEEKNNYRISTTPHHCSRGVSTDEIHEFKPKNSTHTEFNLESPPSTTSSTSLSDKANNDIINNSKRFEDGDPVGNDPLLSRSSMLFSLIACGGSASFRKTEPPAPPSQTPVVKKATPTPQPSSAARKSGCGGGLHKGVVCKAAAKVAVEDDEEMIGCMSENPRFGNMQVEEKEYFSGSIVESMNTDERLGPNEPGLKKSSSYNEERSKKAELGEAAVESEEEMRREKGGVKGKCIPRKKSSSNSKHCKK